MAFPFIPTATGHWLKIKLPTERLRRLSYVHTFQAYRYRRFQARRIDQANMGLLRLALALFVVQAHAGAVSGLALLPTLDGREAVQIFYVISGFYMSLILNRKYIGSAGRWLFYSNRFFRLWPPYIVVIVAATIALYLLGQACHFDCPSSLSEVFAKFRRFGLATQAYLLLTNIFIVGQDFLWLIRIDDSGAIHFAPYMVSAQHNGFSFSINPPIFTVAIETSFYVVAPFILCRRAAAIGFMLSGAGYHVLIHALGSNNLAFSYHIFLSAAYFFGLGAISYQAFDLLESLRGHTDSSASAKWAEFACVLLGSCVLLASWRMGNERIFFLAIATMLLMPTLFRITKGIAIDRFFGELSYGVYIAHWPIILIAQAAYAPKAVGANLVAGASILLAMLLYVVLEKPIDEWRQRRVLAAGHPPHRSG